MELGRGVFTAWQKIVREKIGVVIPDGKEYLINSRLLKLLKRFGLTDFEELLEAFARGENEVLVAEVIDLVTTHETSFFRDSSLFDSLESLLQDLVIPQFRESGRDELRIWSAACSSGEEVYSLAVYLHRLLGTPAEGRWSIYATDIAQETLARAEIGRYHRLERRLDMDFLMRYFHPDGCYWQVKPFLKEGISFAVENLLEEPKSEEHFDLIFCRNVAIYFTAEDKCRLYERLGRQLQPAGVLVVGASETMLGIPNPFERFTFGTGVYYRLALGREKALPSRFTSSVAGSRSLSAIPDDRI